MDNDMYIHSTRYNRTSCPHVAASTTPSRWVPPNERKEDENLHRGPVYEQSVFGGLHHETYVSDCGLNRGMNLRLRMYHADPW